VLSRRPIRRDVAMTGEVTLRGKVLEIGGVKEKVLAAYRAGLREVIMPKSNEKDLRDVPDEVKQNMKFNFVERMDEVLAIALLPDRFVEEDDVDDGDGGRDEGGESDNHRVDERRPAEEPEPVTAKASRA
jgi:ATP-dependent Lon protease